MDATNINIKRDIRMFKRLILLAIIASLLSIVLAHAADKPASAPAADTTSIVLGRDQVIRAWQEQIKSVDLKFQQSLSLDQREMLDMKSRIQGQIGAFLFLRDSTVRVAK